MVPKKYLLDTSNVHFREQPFFRFCGHCQIATILEYAGIHLNHYTDVHTSRFSAKTGFLLPRAFGKIANYYGLSYNSGRIDLTPDDTLTFLKNLLITHRFPVIIEIAHGYREEKRREEKRKTNSCQ